MRIIFLNTWHGQVWEKLKKFLELHSKDTDVFCFVEVDPDLEIKLEKVLFDFTPLYEKGIKMVYMGGVTAGQSIFIKKGTKVSSSGIMFPYRQLKTDAGGFQYIQLNIAGKDVVIGCLHGKTLPGDKLDTPIRLRQSEKIINFFADKNGPKIVGGDFNLDLSTKSVLMFEEVGYRNLIKDFNIKNTRNKLSWKQFNNIQHFADFCFVSPEVKVKNFEVPQLEISDHLPLILDFDL